MLIRDRLEAAFETEPPDVPLDRRLAAGRTALRRRRVGQGVLSVAVVAVMTTGVLAIGHATTGPDGPQPAATGGPDTSDGSRGTDKTGPATSVTPAPTNPSTWPAPESLAYLDGSGGLHLRPGATLLTQQWLPKSGQVPPDRELELALTTRRGETWWLSLEWNAGQRTLFGETVGPWQTWEPGRFHTWVDDHRASTKAGNGAGDPGGKATAALQLVHFTSNGDLVPDSGVTLLGRRPDPGFADFNPDGVPVAVAEVRVNGARRFVIARDNGDGTTQNISVLAGAGDVPPTLDGFIAWAKAAYASGRGLL